MMKIQLHNDGCLRLEPHVWLRAKGTLGNLRKLLKLSAESDRWYEALSAYIDRTPVADANRRIAREAVAYLDIALPHRGTGNILKTLVSTAKLGLFTDSESW
jgi:hypothetical protein